MKILVKGLAILSILSGLSAQAHQVKVHGPPECTVDSQGNGMCCYPDGWCVGV